MKELVCQGVLVETCFLLHGLLKQLCLQTTASYEKKNSQTKLWKENNVSNSEGKIPIRSAMLITVL